MMLRRVFFTLLLAIAPAAAQIAPVTTVVSTTGGQPTEMWQDSLGNFWVLFDSFTTPTGTTTWKTDSLGNACSAGGTNCQVKLWNLQACQATASGVLSPSTCASTTVDILAPLRAALAIFCGNCDVGDPIWDGNVAYFSIQGSNTATPTAGCGAVCGNSDLDPGKGYNYGWGSVALTPEMLRMGTALTSSNFTLQFYAGQFGYVQLGDCGVTALPAGYQACGGGHADPVFSDDHGKVVVSALLYQPGVSNSAHTITTTHSKWQVYWGNAATVSGGAPTVVSFTALPNLGTQTTAQISNGCPEYIKANQPISQGGGVYWFTAASNLNSANTTPPNWTGTTYTRPQASTACTAIGGDLMFSFIYGYMSNDVTGSTYYQVYPTAGMPYITADAAKYPIGYSEFTRLIKQTGPSSYLLLAYTTAPSRPVQVEAAAQPNFVSEWALVDYDIVKHAASRVYQLTNMNYLHSAQNNLLLANPSLTGGMSRPTYNAALNVVCGDTRSGTGAGTFQKLTCLPLDKTNFPMSPLYVGAGISGKATVSGKATISLATPPVYPGTAFGAAAAQILGPAVFSGMNPWPYADATNIQAANYFGALQNCTADTCFNDFWNVPASGTVSSPVSGGNTFTFSSINTQTVFCSGGTSPTSSSSNSIPGYFYPWYQSGAHRYPLSVTGCPTSSTVTTYQNWYPAQESGMTFSLGDAAQDANIEGQSAGMQYYDSVMAFYSLYFRTQNVLYLNYARTMADRWITQPFIDKGQRAIDGQGIVILNPRKLALTGLVLRALDGQSGYWTAIEAMNNYYGGGGSGYGFNMAAGSLIDIREAGYVMYFLALQGMYDPTSANATAAMTAFDFNLTHAWGPARVLTGVDAGAWENLVTAASTWNGSSTATLAVVNGSATVTASAALAAGFFPGNWFLACAGTSVATPASNAGCDPTAYRPTQVDATHFTLDRAYAGTTRTVYNWGFGQEVGYGTQPYMLGMPARAFDMAINAGDSNSAMLLSWLTGSTSIATYLSGSGFNSHNRGLWYGTGFPNCNAQGRGNIDCDDGDPVTGLTPAQSRDLTPEVMGAIALLYKRTPSSALRTFAENVYSAQWAGPNNGCQNGVNTGPIGGGALVDGVYVSDLILQYSGGACSYTSAPNSKYWGFQFGFGGAQAWPGVR